jgi:ABC-type multidrug transport system permease subunit
MACVCVMHMLIYEKNMILLRMFRVYLTPAPRKVVGVEVLLLDGFMCLPCSSWLAGDDLLHQSLLNNKQFLVELFLVALATVVFFLFYVFLLFLPW